MTLSAEQIRSFKDAGVLVVRDAVAEELVDRVRELAEGWMASEYDPAQVVEYTNRTFAPTLGKDPRVLALFHDSRLNSDCQSLFGDASFEDVRSAQVALRLPVGVAGAAAQPVKEMHVDGVNAPFLPKGELRTFTLNVGVMIDDVGTPSAGALHYVPAGHLRMAQWFKDGPRPPAEGETPEDISRLPGRPLCGRRGDAVIMHHLLPHRVGPNNSEQLRSMVYFRVRHVAHDDLQHRALADPWLELPGVRDLDHVRV